ncbi:ADP-ribosylation/Crystallin J1 [Echria macrotheca]|uniref:ADP-ribosylhydrolase ARH3 n=1 Tax=Echria macrotheca TaxID=438768 RepID=A0AAJ0B150_9PEZI|nr:ADP-ribosylation/Crystallin J1 [Echria macrotheca]
MLDWYEGRWPGRVEGETPVDVGGATALGLRKFRNTGDPKTSGAGEGKAGNGSLMRCLPTGLFQHNEDKLLAESMAISAITHDDFLCTISCAYYNSVVRYLLDGVPAEKAMHVSLDVIGNCVPYEKRNEKSRLAAQKVYRAAHWASLIHLDDLAARGPKNALNGPQILPLGASGFVLESLTIALAALLDPRPLEDVLVDIVKIGRDTDTNGAIAGGLLGAQRGLEAIPQRWRDKLQFGSEFTALVDEILALRRSPSP